MAVGWNCINSRLATSAPARYAMAMPSPVAISGFVVYKYTQPVPPVASITTGVFIVFTTLFLVS